MRTRGKKELLMNYTTKKTKLKRLISIALSLILAFGMAQAAFAYDKDIDTDINDDEIYYAKGYRNNDCVLSSNMYMIRRAAIQNGSTCWDSITLSKLRKDACTSPNGHSLKYSYTFEADGITYEVVHGLLSGSKDSKTSQLKKLLKKHPEGIVVRGKSTQGYGHGILVTSYEDKMFYAADSAQNYGGSNRGILKMSSTTVPNLGSCTHIWYIEKISGKSMTAVKRIKAQEFTAGKHGSNIVLTWTFDTDYHELDGYVLYVSDTGGEEEFSSFKTVEDEEYAIENLYDGQTYYYQVRGFVEKGDKRVYTDIAQTSVVMN